LDGGNCSKLPDNDICEANSLHPLEGDSWCLFPNHCPWRCTYSGTIVRGTHHKIKPDAVLDYKYSVGRSDQMLSHYSFERKTKLWRKLFFHLLDLVVANAQMLHNRSSKKNTSLEIFYEKVARQWWYRNASAMSSWQTCGERPFHM
jgi:hypothetical protein